MTNPQGSSRKIFGYELYKVYLIAAIAVGIISSMFFIEGLWYWYFIVAAAIGLSILWSSGLDERVCYSISLLSIIVIAWPKMWNALAMASYITRPIGIDEDGSFLLAILLGAFLCWLTYYLWGKWWIAAIVGVVFTLIGEDLIFTHKQLGSSAPPVKSTWEKYPGSKPSDIPAGRYKEETDSLTLKTKANEKAYEHFKEEFELNE